MINVAPRLERSRRCLAMLVPRVAAYRDVEKQEAERSRTTLGWLWDSYTCASRCDGCISGKACVNTVPVSSQLPSFHRKKKTAFCWTATVFSPLTKWQPCCRQPGSPGTFCERGGTGGKASGSALFPPLHRGGLASLLLWLEIQLRSGEWRTAMWAKKRRGCHRNARLSP